MHGLEMGVFVVHMGDSLALVGFGTVLVEYFVVFVLHFGGSLALVGFGTVFVEYFVMFVLHFWDSPALVGFGAVLVEYFVPVLYFRVGFERVGFVSHNLLYLNFQIY